MVTEPSPTSRTEAHTSAGLTEEQIIDIFSSAGKVLNFRLVYDRETGRPKGFGFAEYPDSGSFHAINPPRWIENSILLIARVQIPHLLHYGISMILRL
jgi:hypothetical protein